MERDSQSVLVRLSKTPLVIHPAQRKALFFVLKVRLTRRLSPTPRQADSSEPLLPWLANF